MSNLTYKGQDDYLPDSALDKILELTESMPEEFSVGSTQAYRGSVQATVKFPAEGPMAQMEALQRIFLAAEVLGTTARNLKHERDQANPVYTKIRICHYHMSTVQGTDSHCDYWHSGGEEVGECEDIRERRVIIE